MYRNELLMDESGDSGIFHITDCNCLTRSSLPRPPAWVQCLLSRRLLRPRGRHPPFTLPQSTFIQSSSVKSMPQICVSPSLPCLYLGNPQNLSPGMSPALTGLPWGFTLNTAGRVGLSHFLPARSLLWCHVLAEPLWGAQAPSSPVITDLHRLGLSCPNLNVEPEATFLSILCMWPKTLPAAQ